MGNTQSSGGGGHRRTGSRSQHQSAAAASLSSFQTQASLQSRLRQQRGHAASSKTAGYHSGAASGAAGGPSGPGGSGFSGLNSVSSTTTNTPSIASVNDISPYRKASITHSPSPSPSRGETSSLSSSPTQKAISPTSVLSGPRRRKSIELPDLDPSLGFTTASPIPGSSAATPLPPDSAPMQGSRLAGLSPRKGLGDLANFKLRLPDKHRARLIDAGSSAGSTMTNATEQTMREGIEAMRLDVGDDHPGEGAAGYAASRQPRPPPTQATPAPDAAVEPAQPAPVPDIEVEGTKAASPSAIAPDNTVTVGISAAPFPLTTSPSVLIPLQQPIETVVPPLPPTIIKPFPPPLPVAPVTTGSSASAAAVNKMAAATEAVKAAPALDLGAGPEGVPTLITWKEPANEVYVTGTFCRWKQQIKLRKDPEAVDQTDYSALILLQPGPHRLKFIVDKKWKTSKYLPTATDAAGNLINYLQVELGDAPFRGLGPRGIWSGYTYGNWSLATTAHAGTGGQAVLDPHDSEWHDNDDDWTTEIPQALIDYEDVFDRIDPETEEVVPPPEILPGPGERGYSTEPPKLPAQLTQGVLNMGSKALESVTDDNSLLPKPDHSVLNHLAASPIKHGLLSVGVTTRYKRKYLTTVLYKALDPSPEIPVAS